MRDDASVEKYFAQEEEYQRRVMAAATKGPNPLSPDQVNALSAGLQTVRRNAEVWDENDAADDKRRRSARGAGCATGSRRRDATLKGTLEN
jgi:hypothetical protein